MQRMTPEGTASRVLDIAERLAQQRGFNGFSYADVAAELEITKASLHYHFRSKSELGEALIRRYTDRFVAGLTSLDEQRMPAREKLHAYAGLYREVLANRRMCLCGMLAAEYGTLPELMRDAVIAFFDRNEQWLARVLEQGRDEGTLVFAGPAADAARALIGGLEGAMLVTRPYGDLARFDAAADRLLAAFETPASR